MSPGLVIKFVVADRARSIVNGTRGNVTLMRLSIYASGKSATPRGLRKHVINHATETEETWVLGYSSGSS